jgi:ribosomal protein L40E
MIYDDGVEINENMQVRICPKCGNEQFSSNANYCRICGFSTYNWCEGRIIYNDFGNLEDIIRHENLGNSRFCEICGKPTLFLSEKILLPYDEVREDYVEEFLKDNPEAIASNTVFIVGGKNKAGILKDVELL